MAEGKSSWIKAKQEADSGRPLLIVLHNDLVQHYRTFLMVGGMPASVAAWVNTHDYRECQTELDDIQLTYYDDFAKYAKKVDPTLLRICLMLNKKVPQRVESRDRMSALLSTFLFIPPFHVTLHGFDLLYYYRIEGEEFALYYGQKSVPFLRPDGRKRQRSSSA